MGINYTIMEFLLYCADSSSSLKEKIDFSSVITLGRQNFSVGKDDADKFFAKRLGDDYTQEKREAFFKNHKESTSVYHPESKYSEPFFKVLGAKTVDSLDYSDYQGATIIHDLCVPIPETLKNKYTCVYDGGTLEHIYNFNVALKSVMDMVAVGGHLALVIPGNNCFGHGFYQFSPELFYSVLREENGFSDTKVFLCNDKTKQWYFVTNPRDVSFSTELNPKFERLELYIVSQKIGSVPEYVNAFQSVYDEVWSYKEFNLKPLGKFEFIRRFCPVKVKKIIRYYWRFKKLFVPVDLWK